MTQLPAMRAKTTDRAVRVALGHFISVYVHPYMDGNGRLSILDEHHDGRRRMPLDRDSAGQAEPYLAWPQRRASMRMSARLPIFLPGLSKSA
jgi:hypothetical protein